MTSNITSMDYRRRSLGELQRSQEQLAREVDELKRKASWQEMYIETLEQQFSSFQEDYEFMNNNLLSSIQDLHLIVMRLGVKSDDK